MSAKSETPPATEPAPPPPVPAPPAPPVNPFAKLRTGMMVSLWQSNRPGVEPLPAIVCKVHREPVTGEPTGEINAAVLDDLGVWQTSLHSRFSETPIHETWTWRE